MGEDDDRQAMAPGFDPDRRYDALTFNAPLSDARADGLAKAVAAHNPALVLDLGCGWAELLLRVLAAAPGARGRGIDPYGAALARAETAAAERGLADRLELVEADAAGVTEGAPAVICVGADHAFGRLPEAVRRLADLTEPGGILLLGTGYWRSPPAPEQAAALGATPADLTDLAGLVEVCTAAGLRPLDIQTAGEDEWNAFESGYLAATERWLLAHPSHPDAADLTRRADEHRTGWLRGYRGVLGFAYLILGRPVAAR